MQTEETDKTISTIDWHDFVIVETITFTKEAPTIPPPPPMPQQDNKMEIEEKYVVPEPQRSAPMPVKPVSGIKIREDYIPQLNAAARVSTASSFIDPNTGNVIPIDQSAEHMRIALLDPKWQDQRKRALERQKDSAYAGGDSIVENLNRLASRRTDIFNEDAEEGQEPKQKKSKTTDAIIWDGSTASVSTVMAEQMDRQRESLAKVSAPIQPTPSAPPLAPLQPNPTMGYTVPASTGSYLPPPSHLPPPPPPPSSIGGYHTPQAPLISGSIYHPPPQQQQHQHHVPPPPPPSSLPPPVSAPPRVSAVSEGRPQPPLPPPPASKPPAITSTAPSAITSNEDGEETMESSGLAALGLIEESAWKASHASACTVHVYLPVDDSTPSWNMRGQCIKVNADLGMNVNDLKELLSSQLGHIPLNKFQVKNASHGFLKDKLTLAYYNFDNGARVDLHLKKKGKK